MHPLTYWKNLVGSLTSINWYFSLLSRPLSFSLRFFFLSCLLLGVATALKFNLVVIPTWQDQLTASLAELQAHYPPALIISWDNQVLSLTPAESISVQYPSQVSVDTDIFPSLLGYFSPQDLAESELERELPSRSLFLITPSSLFVNESGGGWNQLPLTTIPGFDQPFTITAQSLPEYIATWQSIGDSVLTVIAWLNWLFWPLSLIVTRLWISLFDTFLFYFLLQLNRFRVPFKKAWQIVLHVLITASIIELVTNWLYADLGIPMLTVSTWMILVYLVLSLRSRQKSFLTVTEQQ